jgi:hypothetical protein
MADGATPDQPIGGTEAPLVGRCGARLRNKPGRYCSQTPLKGRTRCKFHGGASLSGINSGRWKHGMYAKDLPGSLASDYKAARKNPDIVSHVEQIALLDARILDVLRRLNAGESAAAWEQAGEATDRLDAAEQTLTQAQRDKNIDAMRDSLAEIKSATAALVGARKAAAAYLQSWDELKTLFLLRKRLVDSESRRRKDAHEMITKDRVLAMFGLMARSVQRNVSDPRERQAIVNDFRLLIAGNGEAA